MALSNKDIEKFAKNFDALAENIEKALFGKRQIIELVIAAMISEGHVLLEDFPGTGKTALARALSQSIKGAASRIQFTPDLLPGDVTGISVFDQKKGTFEFHSGPIFANVVLADEINRASPKTQSALLEAMEEGKVTVDGVTRTTGVPFLVIATQNPIEQAGTYRLPEAQLDRFMLKTSVGYPDASSTIRILEGTADSATELAGVSSLPSILEMQDIARGVYVNPLVLDYIVRLVEATRNAPQVKMGSSVRGARNLTKLAKTWAVAHGRSFVTPDDVKDLAEAVLAHRIVLDPEAEFDGVTANAVIGQILLDTVPPTGGEA
jgi:MoxR-like ATPase